MTMPTNVDDIIGKLSPAQRKKVEARAAQLIAEQMTLRELRHALAKIFQEGKCRDPALRDTSIAVTEVRMSPDLRNATAFVAPLGGENATVPWPSPAVTEVIVG